MVGFAAERLMQIVTDGLCGAGPHERSVERTNQRNGYRDWQTRAGTVELRILNCAGAATSLASLNPAAWPRKP